MSNLATTTTTSQTSDHPTIEQANEITNPYRDRQTVLTSLTHFTKLNSVNISFHHYDPLVCSPVRPSVRPFSSAVCVSVLLSVCMLDMGRWLSFSVYVKLAFGGREWSKIKTFNRRQIMLIPGVFLRRREPQEPVMHGHSLTLIKVQHAHTHTHM